MTEKKLLNLLSKKVALEAEIAEVRREINVRQWRLVIERKAKEMKQRAQRYKQITEAILSGMSVKDLCSGFGISADKVRSYKRHLERPRCELDPLGFSNHTWNVFDWVKIKTLDQICEHTEQDLLKYRDFGKTSLIETLAVLSLHGRKLKGQE